MTYELINDDAVLPVVAPLPKAAEPPTWITIFPQIGPITTRDGRSYDVDAQALIARFNSDGLDIPIDINHSTPRSANTGEPADAVGWITELRVKYGALQGKVDWLEEGREVLRKRTHRFVSPDFFHSPEGKTKWLRAVALVTAPALANQRALAAARSAQSASLAAKSDDIIYAMIATPMSRTKPLQEWVVVFAALGFVETQTEDIFYIDGKAICDAFTAARRSDDHDYREFPVCVEHLPDIQIDKGEDVTSAPIGEIVDLQINKGRLEAKIDWKPDASQIVNQKGLTSVSPTFFSDQGGKVKRLKSISLVRRPMPLLRSRAVGNDVAPEERGYQPKAATLDAREQRVAELSEMLRQRVAQIASIGRVSRDELFLLTIFRLEREYLLGGLTPDQSEIRRTALKYVEDDPVYELSQLFPGGGVKLEGALPQKRSANLTISSDEATRQGVQLAARAKQLVNDALKEGVTLSFLDAVARAEAELSAKNARTQGGGAETISALSGASTSRRAQASAPRHEAQNGEWSADDLVREAGKEMAQASALGAPINYMTAVERVQKRFGLEIDPDTGALVANAAGGSDAKLRAGEWSADDLVREAGKEMAQASAAGAPIDMLRAVERISERFGLETDPDTGALVAHAAAGSDAKKRTGEWSADDLVREAGKEMARASAFGTPITYITAVLRVQKRFGLETDPDTGALVANAAGGSDAKLRAGEWSADDLVREAGKEMAQASAFGEPINYMTAVERVQKRFGLEIDPDTGAFVANAAGGSDAKMRAGEWSADDLVREAGKEMAQASAFGTPIDIVSAMERVKQRLCL